MEYELFISMSLSGDALADLRRRLNLMFTTPLGTMPLERAYGIDWSFLDMPTPAAKSLFTAEVADKIQTFFPELRIEELTWTTSPGGALIPRVVITGA